MLSSSSFLVNDFYFPSTENIYTFNNTLSAKLSVINSKNAENHVVAKMPLQQSRIVFTKLLKAISKAALYR